MKALALLALALLGLAVLALACVLRVACRRAVRAAIVAHARAREAVATFAASHGPVALHSEGYEPEPTVCERLQYLLAADEVKRAESAALIAKLEAGLKMTSAQLVALRAAEEQAKRQGTVDAEIARAFHVRAAWLGLGGLNLTRSYTPDARGN